MYHLNEKGEPGACSAQRGNCPFGSTSQHFESKEAARAAFEQQPAFSATPLSLSHGQWVRRGEVGVSDFLKAVAEKRGENNRYSGTYDELAALTKAHLATAEPGTGSVNGDVLLVRVPADNFYTNIIELTDENRHRVETIMEARREGEAPVEKRIVKGAKHAPAKVVKIVTYRADVLAKDDDRSTPDEWEIVAILAQPEEIVPMHPTTMERNASNAAGGTLRTYTDEQWAEARAYWEAHAFADE